MSAKIIYHPRNKWEFITPDGRSYTSHYEYPIVTGDYVAFPAYYGEERIFKLGEFVPVEIEDKTMPE